MGWKKLHLHESYVGNNANLLCYAFRSESEQPAGAANGCHRSAGGAGDGSRTGARAGAVSGAGAVSRARCTNKPTGHLPGCATAAVIEVDPGIYNVCIERRD